MMNIPTNYISDQITSIDQSYCNVDLISIVFNFLIKPTDFYQGTVSVRSISTRRIRKLKRARVTKMLGTIFR